MKNKSHPIPKEQQIKQTAYNQKCMVQDFIEGKSYNVITRRTGAKTKRDLGLHGQMEGRAVERKVCRLFKGKVWIRGKYHEELIKFDKLPNRMGQPFHKNEIRCLKIGIKWERDISTLSRLTGRDKKEIQKMIDKRNGKTLFN